MPLLNGVAECLLVALVDFVDEQKHRNGHLLNLVEEVHVLLGIFHYVCDIQQHVGILQCRLRECEHRLLQLVVGFQYTWRIRENYLGIVLVDYAHDTMARGLRLECGNADALAYQLIHQRRLAHIRIAYYIYKSCFVHILFL